MLTLTPSPRNRPPSTARGTIPTATKGHTWTYQLTAEPFNPADSIQYSLGNLPSALADAQINPSTGVITWAVPANYSATTAASTVIATEIDHNSGATLLSSSMSLSLPSRRLAPAAAAASAAGI